MSGSCDFVQLGASLEVIREHACDPGQFQLIPDPDHSGIRIEKSTSFMGHVLQFFTDVANLFPKIQLPCSSSGNFPNEEAKVRRTLRNVAKEFEKALVEMRATGSQYREALLRSSRSSTGPERKERANIFHIADTLHSLFPGKWRDLALDVAPLQKLFMAHISKPILQEPEMKTVAQFQRDHAMAAVEGILFQPFPMQSFSAIIHGEHLDAGQQEALNDWNRCLDEKRKLLTVGLLHLALWGVLEAILNENGETIAFAKKLASFEWELFRSYKSSGFRLFAEEDPDHLAWLKSLEGMGEKIIHLRGERLLLGNKVECAAFADQKVVVYNIEGDTSRQVMISLVNQVQLGLWQAACEEIAWGVVPPIRCLGLHPYGNFCLIERVHSSLTDSLSWLSSAAKVDQNDEPILRPIVDFLAAMKQEKVPPTSLLLKNFFLVRDTLTWFLRSFPLMEQMPTYPEEHKFRLVQQFELFAISCAKNNRFVFRHLIYESGFIDHPLVQLYREAMIDRLSGHEISEVEVLAKEGIVDDVITQQLKAFIDNFPEAQNRLYARLQPRLKDPALQSELKKAIVQELVAFQRDFGYCTIVHPRLLEDSHISIIENHLMGVEKYRGLFE
ncbi:MAG: hypothetical protein JSR46_00265 [Verrucomicrobia bacterium]|nr:hypothetical protein [Verrucomicrobiota bacterium]